MRNATRLTLVLAVLAAGSIATWWYVGRGVEITTISPFRGTAVQIVYATGAVEPIRWAKVTSLVRNRIVELCDCEGKNVRKGDVLARLDEREVKAQLSELRAREEFAKRELSRVTELIARNAATTQSFERAQMDMQQVQATILVQLRRVEDFTIVSPMDGVVLRRDGQVGEMADVGQVLFTVGEPQPLQVVAEVNEEDIPRVVVGQQVLFRTDAFPDSKIEGRIREITPMGDVVAKTYRVKISLPDDTPLKPGMSVEANIVTLEKSGALLVPAVAVERDTVFVVEDGRLRRRTVVIGIRGTRNVEILSGINEKSVVASPIRTEFSDGQRVRSGPGATTP